MQDADFLILLLGFYALFFFLFHLFAEGARGVFILGLGFWVGEPELVGYSVCFFLGPFFCGAGLVYGIFLP
jgi:hypothetical protein